MKDYKRILVLKINAFKCTAPENILGSIASPQFETIKQYLQENGWIDRFHKHVNIRQWINIIIVNF